MTRRSIIFCECFEGT